MCSSNNWTYNIHYLFVLKLFTKIKAPITHAKMTFIYKQSVPFPWADVHKVVTIVLWQKHQYFFHIVSHYTVQNFITSPKIYWSGMLLLNLHKIKNYEQRVVYSLVKERELNLTKTTSQSFWNPGLWFAKFTHKIISEIKEKKMFCK